MPVDLSKPLAWKAATGDTSAMLSQLQPNIVKAHVREHMRILLVQFSDRAEARAFLKAVAGKMKSAKKHLLEVERFKQSGVAGTPYVGVGLTFEGYRKLGVAVAKIPSNDFSGPFRASMRSARSVGDLADPPVSRWEEPYRHTVHAVILVGDATLLSVQRRRDEIKALMTPKVKLLGQEIGLGQHNARGDGIEHFGYIDGRSQPLFLTDEIASEPKAHWNPAFALNRVLVKDSAAPKPAQHFGSFFVLRKLEQDVRAFHQAEQDLADKLGLAGEDRKRAGATIVGRFRDGTALTAHSRALGENPIPNDFDYDKDAAGNRCPFHGHIRKTNPRESATGRDERQHLMARRGQTYGTRTDDVDAQTPSPAQPRAGVGLLFMAFNSEIDNQFAFTQSAWANAAGFPFNLPPGRPEPGLDQVIGQGSRPKAECPVAWGKPANKLLASAKQTVTMKGGEYFFMPSIAFLKAL